MSTAARTRTNPTEEAPVATTPDDEHVVEADAVEVDGAGNPVEPELALAIRDERATAVQPSTSLPTPREWEATMAIARQIAATPFVPESYRHQPEAVVAAILTGRELGIGPMQALRDIHMVDGRPAFAAQLMLARMRGGGIVLLESEATTERAYIKARRPDGEVGVFEFTIAEAEAAGLLAKKGQSWTKYRKDMLWARCVSRMARRFGSDMLGGLVYSKEELEDADDDGGYGGLGGYDATADKPFDPATDLYKPVPGDSTAEVAAQLNEWQARLASDIAWPAVLEEAALACLGPKANWTAEAGEADAFMRRWANAITKLLELAEASPDLYQDELGIKGGPEGDALIVEAFEFAFDVTPSLPLPRVEAMIVNDDPADGEDATPDVTFGDGD